MDLIYMGRRKRQDLLSKLGAWGLWERVDGEGRGRQGIFGGTNHIHTTTVEFLLKASPWQSQSYCPPPVGGNKPRKHE